MKAPIGMALILSAAIAPTSATQAQEAILRTGFGTAAIDGVMPQGGSDEAGALDFGLAAPTAVPPPASMDQIYAAIVLENVRPPQGDDRFGHGGGIYPTPAHRSRKSHTLHPSARTSALRAVPLDAALEGAG
jgi:hypothetical protein